MLFAITAFVFGLHFCPAESCDQPNIIFILIDDMGWNDLSLHGSPQIPTPNIDALASSSIILHNFYAQPLCTPSRAALLSGLYPIRLGLEHFVHFPGEPSGMPLGIPTLPEHLKDLGYATHMVGKWHLGYYKKEYTPTFRGFDTFFGFYNGYQDYFDYTHFSKNPEHPTWGVDLQNGTQPILNFRGQYSTDAYTQKGVEIIERHDPSQPLFLYLPYSAIHTGSFDIVNLQAPPHLVARHRHIKDKKRRIYAGMITSLDDAIGEIFKALDVKDLLESTIIVVSSDNGGERDRGGVGSNWPLRGKKGELWEGGIRVPAFVWSPLLGLKEPRTSTQLMHMSDWLPTLYFAAGGNLQDLEKTDGYNMWPAFVNNSPSPRKILLHNIDPVFGVSALRSGNYKLVNGTMTSKENDWSGATGFEEGYVPTSLDEHVFSQGSVVKDILEASGWWLPTEPDAWRANLTVRCTQPPPKGHGGCNPAERPCLFNVVADPCEYKNLAPRYPKIVKSMMQSIKTYAEVAAEPQLEPFDPRSEPSCHGFAHVPWMDPEHLSNCPYL